MSEIMEQKDKANEEKRFLSKEKNNEIHVQSIQQENSIDELNDVNHELINLREENEIFRVGHQL